MNPVLGPNVGLTILQVVSPCPFAGVMIAILQDECNRNAS
jgi:hypothetical protein